MLCQEDIHALSPYLALGKAVNIEIKNYTRNNKQIRDVLIEYADGRKMVGDLNTSPLKLKELHGLTSIASYFARGKYGSNSWRGNCSGLLIRDLLLHYKPSSFGDLAVGSGTSIEVAKDLGYTDANTVFSDLNPKYGGIDLSNPDLDFPLMDFIFFHPPYFVFPGSSMPTYSGKHNGGMWGEEIHPKDGSRINDPWQFKKWFDQCNANLYKLLHKGGRLAILMGDSRYKNQYYSMFKNMDIYGTLEQVIVKRQHNCMSDSVKYAGRFIPLEHEYLVIIKKDCPYLIPIITVNLKQRDIRESTKITWAALMAMILEDHNYEMDKDTLLTILKQHPKAKGNNFCAEKLRQELHLHPHMFYRKENKICLARPA